jgi:hypothetical protein
LRKEDKKEGEDLEEASHFCFRISERYRIFVLKFLKDRGGGNWKNCFGELSQGTVVAENFGLGGQETARILGARESERLFLVGWEVNIQLDSWASSRPREPGTKSTNLHVEVRILYILCCQYVVVIMLLVCCCY